MDSLAQLKWRCRRGAKELDYLLLAFLEQKFDTLNKQQQHLFIELLQLPDTQLIFYLLGDKTPQSKGLAQLVKKIRTHASFSNQAIHFIK